jgi:hypothetical protein
VRFIVRLSYYIPYFVVIRKIFSLSWRACPSKEEEEEEEEDYYDAEVVERAFRRSVHCWSRSVIC